MYRQHFGLQEHPFSLTPDTQFYFSSQSHREVLSTLLLALRHSEGFIKIVGEVGTGKTLLSRKLLASLGDNFITAYIPNPYLTPDELKWFLAEEIGISYSPEIPSYQLLKDINLRLVELAQQKRQVVLIVDEAQAMPRETIEALRLLTNLETEKSKLLQVVLFGQPELDELLNRPDLRQLKQRIVFSEYLQTIPKVSLPDYLAYRLSSAGYRGASLFSHSAISLLYKASGGVPRLINVMAHKAMLAAYGQAANRVNRSHMVRAISDTAESRSLGRWLARRDYWLWPMLAASAAAVIVLAPGLLGGHLMSLLNDMLRDLSHQQKVTDPALVEQQPALDLRAEEQRELFYNSSAAKPLPRTLLPSLVVFVLVLIILAVWKWGNVNEPAIYAPAIASPNEEQASITSAVAINESPVSEPSVVEPANVEPALGERIAALESAITQLSTVVANVNHISPTETIALTISEQTTTENEQVIAGELQTEQIPLEATPENISSVSIQEPFAPAAMQVQMVQDESKLSISPNAKWQDQQQAQQANQLTAQGQVDIAIEQLQDFIATAQQPRESVKTLLDIFALQERVEAMQALIAQADYLSVVEQQFYKAKVAVIQQQDAQAIELLEMYLGDAEQDENYRALLAGLYQRTGMHLEAANHYRRLLSVFGDKPAYWLGFALAQDALNQPQVAAQAYQRVNQYADLQPQVRAYVQQRIAALQP